MIIQHNMLALNNLNIGTVRQKNKAKNMERLASGYRINRAADDAANMAISEKMTARIRALARCRNNIEEGISLTQTTDGALNEVNAMLNRVNELCVQAANDTNTTEDRSKIAAEITQIYDDMDRIFEDTEFNTMKVFRHDGDNYYAPDPEYLYHESVTALPPGDLHSWGTGMFPTKEFDVAQPATAATATLTLADGVDLNDATSLDGTSFYIKRGNDTYKIEFGQAKNNDYTYSSSVYSVYIRTKPQNGNPKTVQQVFNTLVNSYLSFVDEAKISGNQVSFTLDIPTDSRNFDYVDENGQNITASETIDNGAKNNGISFFSGNTLNQVNEADSTEALKFSTTATYNLKILGNMGKDDKLPPDTFSDITSYITNLRNNTLRLFSSTDKIELSTLSLPSDPTVGDLREAVYEAIKQKDSFSATTYDENTGIISVTVKGLSETVNSSGSLQEIPKPTSDVRTESTIPISVSVQSTTPGSESKTVHTFTIPDFEDSNFYTVKIGNSNYFFYDRDVYSNYEFKVTDTSDRYTLWDTSSIKSSFLSLLRSNYSGYEVTESGGVVTMTSKQLNDTTAINISGGDPSAKAELTLKSVPVLGITGSTYYAKDFSVSLDFSSAISNGILDTTALNGKGFFLNNKYYQFRDINTNSYPKYNDKTLWIDIAGLTSEPELADAIKQTVGLNQTSDILSLSVSTDGFAKLTISGQVKTNSNNDTYLNFADGAPTGTFTTSAVSSGGAAQKNPQTEIDFSKYDMDNLDELYGTGFRITCATCPGEFINVMFCHDKSELNYPPSFDYTDDDGNNRTIHNYMVELKDVTQGSQIAANIADQLKNDLDHFTEVKVSDTNPSILIAQDKRSADQSGRAKVMAGVYTNFLYHVDPEKIPNPDDKVGGGRKDTDAFYAYCMIYAGDTKEKPYIAVHLPHFSVENLKLEYPKEPWDSYEEITNVMNRSKTAAEVVSMARSKIGADQNRLEHAFSYAANAEEQITAANSRIKDMDMADAVTTQAKLTILSNTQEAMLSQIVSLPEQILPLLQQ